MQMSTLVAAVALLLVSSTGLQAAAPVAAADTYDNVHIRVLDPDKAAAWYVAHLGAQADTAPAPGTAQVRFGRTRITIVKTDKIEPSQGSVIDHIGLSYPDIEAKMPDFVAGGAKVISAPRMSPGIFKYGYIEDPWGVKIEIVEDPDKLGFHHVHLRVKDPAATLAWFQERFGGERAQLRGKVDGLRFGGVWLFAAPSGDDAVAPSATRSVMNLAFHLTTVDESTAALKAAGVKVVSEPRTLGPLRYAFLEDPNGVRVELIHRAQ